MQVAQCDKRELVKFSGSLCGVGGRGKTNKCTHWDKKIEYFKDGLSSNAVLGWDNVVHPQHASKM